jgi:hypothetical protein
MTIKELLAATGLTNNDLIPIYDSEAATGTEPTQKITAAQLAAAVKVLAGLVNSTEVTSAISTALSSVFFAANVANLNSASDKTSHTINDGKLVFRASFNYLDDLGDTILICDPL